LAQGILAQAESFKVIGALPIHSMAGEYAKAVGCTIALALGAVSLHGCGKLPIIPEGFTNTTCAKDTTGTCRVAGCSGHRGPTDCVDGKCLCKYGYCAVNGECVSSCEAQTAGSCSLLGCKSDRGPTDCVGGKCMCKPGYCTDHQKYSCSLPCEPDTYGSCHLLGCGSSRGPTDCIHGKCLCKPGFCAQHGVCVETPVIQTSFAAEVQRGREAGVPAESGVESSAYPDLDPMVVAMGAGAFAAVAMSVLAFVAYARRTKPQDSYAQLLEGAD